MAQFEKIYIEISDYCALSCGFCPSSKKKNMRGIMDSSLFSSLCAQIENKTKRVSLHILGDPLSVRDFEKYAQIAHSYRLKIDLVTTGLFLKKKHFGLLLQEPFVQVSFSLSAFLANPKLLTMGHLQTILAFCKQHIQENAPNFINLRLHQKDIVQGGKAFEAIIKEIETFFAPFCPESSRIDLRRIDFWQGSNECDSLQKRKKRIRLAPKILLKPTASFEWEQEDRDYTTKDSKKISKTIHKPLCYGSLKQCGVLSNGELVPCCIDYEGRASFGNIKEQSFQEIIKSKHFQAFRESLKKGIAPCKLCQKCGYRLILHNLKDID